MAGGFGKRLMPYTKDIPKPLLKIKNKTFLEIAINNFRKYGFKEFYISLFYKSEIIKKHFSKKKFKKLRFNYLEENKPLGTAGCLSLLEYDKMNDNIIVFNGDIITDLNIKNLIKFHLDINSDLTVCAKEISNPSDYGKIIYKDNKIQKIIEKPKNSYFVNAGIYIINKKLIRDIKIKKLSMTNFIERKIKEGHSVNIYPIYEYWLDIGKKKIFKQILKNDER